MSVYAPCKPLCHHLYQQTRCPECIASLFTPIGQTMLVTPCTQSNQTKPHTIYIYCIHTHSLSLSLSLSHTHTLTHTHKTYQNTHMIVVPKSVLHKYWKSFFLVVSLFHMTVEIKPFRPRNMWTQHVIVVMQSLYCTPAQFSSMNVFPLIGHISLLVQ